CAKFLVPESERKHGRVYHASERAFQKLLRGYEHSLDFVLDHRLPVLFVTLGTIALSVYLYIIIPKGFFPTQDTGRLSGNVQAAQDISFESMRTKLQQYMRIVQQDPAVENVVSFTGGGGGGGGGGRTNTANMVIALKPLSE